MRILAIDPGSRLGWATDATGRLEWGEENFGIRNGESSGNRWRRFGEWLYDITLKPHTTMELAIDLIVYERTSFVPRGAKAHQQIQYGFVSRLEEHCERHGIALQPVAVQTLKAFAIPKMNRKKGDPKMDRGKDAMVKAAWDRLYANWLKQERIIGKSILKHDEPRPTHNEADALWLYWWALENCAEPEAKRLGLET